jgi:hypothetical protein
METRKRIGQLSFVPEKEPKLVLAALTSSWQNNNWVIAKSIQVKDKIENYWIINQGVANNLDCDNIDCDSVLRKNVYGPFTLAEFEQKKKTLNIDLEF